jgi:hypothetical protein
MGRLDKLKREIITEANRRLLNEQPVDAELNIFCKNTKRNSSFRENGLTLYEETDSPNTIKRLLLTRSTSGVMDNVAGDAGEPGQFMLDIADVESLGDRFIDELDVVEGDIVLVSYSGPIQGVPYFCAIERGTDQSWVDYLNNF